MLCANDFAAFAKRASIISDLPGAIKQALAGNDGLTKEQILATMPLEISWNRSATRCRT